MRRGVAFSIFKRFMDSELLIKGNEGIYAEV